jgi:hypothetical protein
MVEYISRLEQGRIFELRHLPQTAVHWFILREEYRVFQFSAHLSLVQNYVRVRSLGVCEITVIRYYFELN